MDNKLNRFSCFRILMFLLIISVGIGSSEAGDASAVEPSNVEYISHFGRGVGDFSDVAVSGNYAYVADYKRGLVIVDISNPAAPILAGTYETTYNASHVAVSGNYAYVVEGKRGLVIVDISTPSSPTPVGTYDLHAAANAAVGGDFIVAADVAVSGNYAYVVGSNLGLVIMDISTPSSPTLVGSYYEDLFKNEHRYRSRYKSVAISDNFAYIVDMAGYNDIEYPDLVVVNISDPAAPTLVGTYVSSSGPLWDVAISGNYAYAVGNYLTIVDISNPAAPKWVDTTSIYEGVSSYAKGIAVLGNYAYTVGNGLSIVDISNPTATKLSGFFNSNNGMESDVFVSGVSVAVSGNYAYIADGWNGLVIVENDASTKNIPGIGWVGTLCMVLSVFLGYRWKRLGGY